jgi:hypothetical protein
LGSKPQEDASEAVDAVEVTVKLHVKSGMHAITEHANYFGSELGKLLLEQTGREAIGLEIVRSLGLPETTPIRIRAIPVSAEIQGNAIEFKEAPGAGKRVSS